MDNLVSVIVPIYNVYPYLDRCIESIVNQTYTNIEILLINDGSTDQSLDKCLEWRKKDDRIIVIDKKNEKLGPTRNYGIHIARGEYITSVDPDDWVDKRYIECLIYNALKYDADMVICNILSYIHKDNSVYSRMASKRFSVLETTDKKIMFMKSRPTAAFYAKLYKKNMLMQNHIFQPPTSAQDLAVAVQYIACSEVIVTIPDQLYYYWLDRADSISNISDKGDDYIKVFEQSVQDMKRLGLFSKYREGQLAILMCQASALLKKCNNNERRNLLSSKYEELFNNEFPGWQSEVGMKWAVFGSFNARWVAQQISQSIICTPLHICFTSLISQFQGGCNKKYKIYHSNKMREDAVKNDMVGKLNDFCIHNEVGILIDFLEERHDIVVTEDDTYFTKSDAFEECTIEDVRIKKIIKFGSKEFMRLWEESCVCFVEYLKSMEIQVPIYLLKMRLAKGYGIGFCENMFDDILDIEQTNKIIEYMEEFFCKQFQSAIYIQGEEKLYYSLVGHRYGCKPYHLNWYLYEDLANKIWSWHTTK